MNDYMQLSMDLIYVEKPKTNAPKPFVPPKIIHKSTPITHSDVLDVLKRGSGFMGGKKRIYDMFSMKPRPLQAKLASFLKNEYGTGGGNIEFSDGTSGWADHNAKGIVICGDYFDDTVKKVHLSWSEVADCISELIRKGEYAIER